MRFELQWRTIGSHNECLGDGNGMNCIAMVTSIYSTSEKNQPLVTSQLDEIQNCLIEFKISENNCSL